MKSISFIDLSTFSKTGRIAHLIGTMISIIYFIASVVLVAKIVILTLPNHDIFLLNNDFSDLKVVFNIIGSLMLFGILSSLLYLIYHIITSITLHHEFSKNLFSSRREVVKLMNGQLKLEYCKKIPKSIVYINERDFSDIKMPYQLLSINKEFKQPDELYEFTVDSSDYYKLELVNDNTSHYHKSVITNECSSSTMADIKDFYGCDNRQLFEILNEHHKSMELSYMGAKKLACKLIKAQNTLQHHYSIKNTDTVSKGFHQIQKQSKNHDLKFYEDLKTLINEEGIK